MRFILVFLYIAGCGLSQAQSMYSCDDMENVTTSESRNMYNTTPATRSRPRMSNRPVWTAWNGWSMNSSSISFSTGQSTATTQTSTTQTSTTQTSTTQTSTTQTSTLMGSAPTVEASLILPLSSQGPSLVQIDVIIEVHVGNLSGTATVRLSDANISSTSSPEGGDSTPPTPTPMTSGLNQTAVTSCLVASQCNMTKEVIQMSNSTIDMFNTNGSSGPFPSPTALEVFTGKGTISKFLKHRHVWTFILLQLTVCLL
jgi:hypothetical protein